MKMNCKCQNCTGTYRSLLFEIGDEKCPTCKGTGFLEFDFSKQEDILNFVQYIPKGYYWLKCNFNPDELSQNELEKLKEVLVAQYKETEAIYLDDFISQIDGDLWDKLKKEKIQETIDTFVSMYKGWLETGEILSLDDELEVEQEDIDIMREVFQRFHNLSVEHSTLSQSKETIKS
ncbi:MULTISPECIES: hypothetical protein [Bacillus cereus group]|uniref:hypothetical protein n=1 Tax=Bacillus cereus group TaxID=86661 RepID=UPI001298C8EC|nr:hypothetical protein [Bacillus cereus]MRC86023.1 hypothetical protein [Bacillus thuringiensis]HDR6957175.1 hypothetical protein [Bacillus cereus]